MIANICSRQGTRRRRSDANGGISEKAMFVPSHFVPLSQKVFCYSGDELYDDKTFVIRLLVYKRVPCEQVRQHHDV
ncbi:hypothetical protein PoB_001374800 [Plakobranchus ocellatus]|uniref:Uncharacterized protein n=1 Tax=Plakobranchus ocellatus TaxID=259542 RepID=A0AAV3YXH6_9GAST|nr:hypothetical protein PoB_001374800 [Plakobranchus ocellatus]